jgi:hypothetical protein
MKHQRSRNPSLRWPSVRRFRLALSPPAKTKIEPGVIEKVNAARKEFVLKGAYLKRMATFEWNASTRFLENGQLSAASELKRGERATVNYARHGKQRLATRIAIWPSGKMAQAGKTQPRKAAGHA